MKNNALSNKIDNENFESTATVRAKIGESASDKVASTLWNYNVKKGSFPAGSYKCNLFVSEMIGARGGKSPTAGGKGVWPLLAGDWANPSVFVKGWVMLPAGAEAQPEDVVSYKYNYSDASGHTAISTGSNAATGTSERVNQITTTGLDLNKGGTVDIRLRRYIGITKT